MCYKKISCLRVACFLTPIFLVGDHCDYGVYSDLLWRNWSSRPAVNRKVVGSSPAGRALLFYKEVHIMNFSIKQH
jgi:hypothetical protein